MSLLDVISLDLADTILPNILLVPYEIKIKFDEVSKRISRRVLLKWK
jgi:hypothetical protein